MITYLFLNKLLFALEIVAAEALFSFKLKRRDHFVLRMLGGIAITFLLAVFFPVPVNTAWYSSLMFFLIFAATIPLLKLCFAEPWRNIVFCAIAGYTVQHFSYQLSNLFASLIAWGTSPLLGLYDNAPVQFSFDLQTLLVGLVYLACHILAYWLLYFVFGKRIKKGVDMKVKNSSLLFLILAGLLADIVLNACLVYSDAKALNVVIDSIYNLLCCTLLLHVQFTLLVTKALEEKLKVVEQLWHEEKEQYAFSKANIDLINRKCHDMRHQIREIGKNKSLSSETIREIEDSIRLYDATVKTDNEVLDIILTEKSLICNRNDIVLSCVADGAALNFMDEADLYSLFGNAMDNAIEAVSKIEESANRLIGLKIHKAGDLVAVKVTNSYTGEIRFDEEGLPLTTKADSDYHGFGMRSISYVVSKYGGDLAVSAEDGVFHLNILIPQKV